MAIQGISDNSIQAILAFRPRFELHTNFAAAAPVLQEVQKLLIDFIGTLEQHGFTQVFDWNGWVASFNGAIDDPAVLSTADADTLQKLITAHIRTDRFVRGHLEGLVAKGYFIALLNRLEVLNAG